MRGLKNVRLPGYDYRSDGYYFVTINSNYRNDNFSGLEDTIEQIFNEVARTVGGVTIDTITVMSDHVHVIYCLEKCSHTLGEIVRRCKAKTSYVIGGRTWKPSYYEHIVRTEPELNRIRAYIIMNPELTAWREEHRKRGSW